MERRSERPQLSAADIWARFGITEHFGGYFATNELLDRCGGIKPGEKILVIGCGTGYTPVMLAREHGADVVATDIDPRMLDLAQERFVKTGTQDRIRSQIADVQELPFEDNIYDKVLAESVLVFTDPSRSVAEIRRVLKPGGVIGINEVTVPETPPRKAIETLTQFYPQGMQILSEQEWRRIFEEAGFEDVTSIVHKLDYWKQFLSHMKIDGPKRYLASVYHMLADPDLRSAFLDRGLMWNTFKIIRYLDYGLYTGKKP